MKIVHVITRLLKGGADENTIINSLHQAGQGHDVTLFYGPDNLNMEHYAQYADRIQFRLLSSLVHRIHPWYDVLAVWQLSALFKEIGPDIVHTHTSKAGIIGRLAAQIARVPLIVHGVHILPFSNTGFISKMVYLAAEHLTAPFTDLFIHVSQGTRQAYADARLGRKKKHTVVYSGMDVEKFRSAEWPESWREILQILPNEPKPKVILMMAALEPRKRQLPFLNGFASVTKEGDPIRLLLAGEGCDRQAVEDKIAALGLQDRVIMLGHHPTPEQFVALSDIGVLASVREGLPRVVVQYMAGKSAAVVSPIEAIEEIVDHDVNGIVVRSSLAEDVAIAAVNLLKDEASCERLKQGASAKDVDQWSYSSMFAALDHSYSLICEKYLLAKQSSITK